MATKPVHFCVRKLFLILITLSLPAFAASKWSDLDRPEHDYWNRPLKDKFSRLKEQLETGKLPLSYRNEKEFLLSLLKALDIPATSQTLVFSTTSLQLRLINIRNPRALYFNEDTYIGFIPGGRIELISIHPELGGLFFIFDIPRGRQAVTVERSTRCMNCHASGDTGNVPGLLAKSVIPGPNGGSLKAYRIGESGHAIPFSERFGGWHLTGEHNLEEHHANRVGRFSNGKLITEEIQPGRRFTWSRYAVRTSDILPHLVFEHQMGFINRALEAGYRTRAYLADGEGTISTENAKRLDEQADKLTRYLLFANEAKFPNGGMGVDPAYQRDFLARAKKSANGASLRDFDLNTRMFKHRCSYMIHSSIFAGLPQEMKSRVFARIRAALGPNPPADLAHLSVSERQSIRTILNETLAGFRAGF
ncbi:MAG: hypothetical protein ACPGVU_25350 [Limisphaerales bacterium]